jgi:hypothetical protein
MAIISCNSRLYLSAKPMITFEKNKTFLAVQVTYLILKQER